MSSTTADGAGSTSDSLQGAVEPETSGGAFGVKGLGWAVFEFARNPYYNVIVITVFAPYFAASVVGDGAQGQALVARTITIAGLIMAVCAPFFGSLIDTGGTRKPPLALILGLLSVTSICLWFVQPGVPGAVALGMALMATGYVAYAISELFHNAMLPMAGRPSALPMISGLGIALGNAASISMLIFVSIFLTGAGDPVFGLSKESFEHLRASGPIVGVWLLVFIIPFFLFMPDIVKTPERSWRRALEGAFVGKGGPIGVSRSAISYVRTLFQLNPNVMRYLVGRMLYADGIAALLTLGSVYVGGFLGWSAGKLIVFNIFGALCAVLGAMLGGLMDQRIGPKRSIMFELTMIIILLTIQLSVTRESILFGLIPSGHVVWEGALFSTLTDVFYLCLIVPIGLMLGACISSSRYMLVHIAPPKQIGQFFGFYAMAGSVTVWLGPGLVDVMTTLSGDQRIGMSGLGILFVAGLWIISGVKADKTPEHMKPESERAA